MYAERARLPARRAVRGRIQSLLVEAMTRLVDGGEQRVAQVGLVVARRQPHVCTDAGGERVHGGIEPALIEVEAETLRDGATEALLRLGGEMPAQRIRVWCAGGML